jgi:hypothetical protein
MQDGFGKDGFTPPPSRCGCSFRSVSAPIIPAVMLWRDWGHGGSVEAITRRAAVVGEYQFSALDVGPAKVQHRVPRPGIREVGPDQFERSGLDDGQSRVRVGVGERESAGADLREAAVLERAGRAADRDCICGTIHS